MKWFACVLLLHAEQTFTGMIVASIINVQFRWLRCLNLFMLFEVVRSPFLANDDVLSFRSCDFAGRMRRAWIYVHPDVHVSTGCGVSVSNH